MVSGLVTSPCDQLRIFSGDARLMRIASKSAIVFCISNGLERNKVFLRFLRVSRVRLRSSEASSQFSVLSKTELNSRLSCGIELICRRGRYFKISSSRSFSVETENRELVS